MCQEYLVFHRIEEVYRFGLGKARIPGKVPWAELRPTVFERHRGGDKFPAIFALKEKSAGHTFSAFLASFRGTLKDKGKKCLQKSTNKYLHDKSSSAIAKFKIFVDLVRDDLGVW